MNRLQSGWLRNRGSILVTGSRDWSLLQSAPTGSGAQKNSNFVGTRIVSHHKKRSGLKYNSLVSIALVKNAGSQTSIPSRASIRSCTTKLRDRFRFTVHIFKKPYFGKKRTIALIMGVLVFMVKWWEAGACKGICHRVIRPLMGVNGGPRAHSG